VKSTNISLVLLVIALVCASLGFAQQEAEPPEGSNMVRQRMEWFYNQRAYPLEHIPAGARLRALKQLDQMLADEAAPDSDLSLESTFDVSSAAISSTRWTLIGPEPTSTPYDVPTTSGRVAALAVDPTNSSVVYAGSAGGGVWKTRDGGLHWTPLTDTQPSLAVGSIAIDPSNHSTIYVGTGEENFSGDSYYGAGILKSVNGGSSWTQIKGPFVGPFSANGYDGGARIGGLAIEPDNSSVILAAVEMPIGFNTNLTAVYRTQDAGATWTAVLPNPTNSPPFFHYGTAVLFDPTNGSIAYAALYYDGVYKSLDAGKTWAPVNGTGSNSLPTTNVGRIVLVVAPSSPNTLYAGIQDTSTAGLLGLFKTMDGGANWVKLVNTPNYCLPQCWYDQAIVVDPNNPNLVFVGGVGTIYRSTDGGSAWTNVSQGANGFFPHTDQHALAFSADSSILYLGNDGGVWSASTPTATPVPWTELNNTLAITEFYFSPSISPTDVTNSLGGTQDNGTQKYSGVLTWDDVVCGDGGWTAMDPVTTSNVYSACPQVNGLVWKSTAGGVSGSWSLAASGINLEEMEFLPPLAIDALHPANLYFGTYRVYQTTNHAGNWTAISPGLAGGAGAVTSIGVAPTDSNTVYAGTDDGWIAVTTNALAGAGAVWNNRNNGARYITQVVVDPQTSTTAYLAYSGFSGFNGNVAHVARTADGGQTWKDISANLPNIPVNGIVIDPVLANTYYVATDIGVFRTGNGGARWSPLGAGLPRVTVLGVTLHNLTRTLRASTHGRSMWDIHVPIADLATSVTESPSPVPHGTNLKYTLNVTNKGPDIATSTVVSDATPVGTTFAGFTTSAGTCTAPVVGTAGTLSCKIGNLANGAKVTVTMTLKDSVGVGSTLTDTGRAFSSTPDPNTKNNSMTVKVSVD
jgi:uncharacterized repeat protein (TIGR01451 family)